MSFGWVLMAGVVLARAPAVPEPVDGARPAAFAEGVVLGEGRAYVMGADGLVAVDLSDGEQAWAVPGAMKPVALAGDRVVVVGADSDQAGVAVLDAATGAVTARCPTPSRAARILVLDRLGLDVGSHADHVDDDVRITWTQRTYWVGGAAPEPGEMEAAASFNSGTLGLDPSTGCVSPADPPELEPQPQPVLYGATARSGPWRFGEVTTWIETRDADGQRSVVLVRERGRKSLPEVEVATGKVGYINGTIAADGRSMLIATQRRDEHGRILYDWHLAALETGDVQRWPGMGFTANAWKPHGERLIVVTGGLIMAITAGGDTTWTQGIRDTGYHGPWPP